ncbi:hypothetical protein [Vreelandella glaciei]|uniref:hypothetical protein n=1 Tax=Vreelandella glaciei TaxID=186761 RepID=UPI00300108E6
MATLNAATYAHREDAEAHYLALIDTAAARARYIDPAQAELYREKFAQAASGGGALLDVEAETLGVDPDAVRQAVLRNHHLRQRLTHRIELARIKAKSDVRKAASAAEMHRIYHQLESSL